MQRRGQIYVQQVTRATKLSQVASLSRETISRLSNVLVVVVVVQLDCDYSDDDDRKSLEDDRQTISIIRLIKEPFIATGVAHCVASGVEIIIELSLSLSLSDDEDERSRARVRRRAQAASLGRWLR